MAELWGGCGQSDQGSVSTWTLLCWFSGSWEVGSEAVGAGGLKPGEAGSGLLPPPGFPKSEPGAKLVGYFPIRVSGPGCRSDGRRESPGEAAGSSWLLLTVTDTGTGGPMFLRNHINCDSGLSVGREEGRTILPSAPSSQGSRVCT